LTDDGNGLTITDKVEIAKTCNVTVIKLDDAPQGYKDFDKGAAKKFVIDPHGIGQKSCGVGSPQPSLHHIDAFSVQLQSS